LGEENIQWMGLRREGDRIGCSNLLHQVTCRQKMFMVMASYEAGAKTAVAGLLASQYTWQELKGKLKALFSNAPQLSEFLAGIEDSGITGICGVSPPSLRSTSRTKSAGFDTAGRQNDSRLACFESCVTEAARRLAPAPAGETVCFIMDWSDPMAASSLWLIEDLRNSGPPDVRDRVGTLGFEDARIFEPLQAARGLACSCALQAFRLPSTALSSKLWGSFVFSPAQPVIRGAVS
jgi:hypothetical protein